jgi:hypothetical protein
MITAEQNELMKRVGPGTPGGKLVRRCWQPAALVEELEGEALAALRVDAVLREGLGGGFVDYFCPLKEAEIARFNLEVSDWEHREYFDLF